MADTLTGSSEPAPPNAAEIDEPVAPTQLDLPAAPPDPAPLPKRPPGRRGVLFATIAGALLVAFAVGGMLLYVFFVRYDATARRHLPSNANIAVRVETAKVVLFEPVRRRLLAMDTSGDKASFSERLRKSTGLDVRTDLREVVIGSVDGTGWLVLVGGHMPSGLIPKLHAFLTAEGAGQYVLEGEVLRETTTGLWIEQADDGTLILANQADLASAARVPSDDYQRIGLGDDAAVNFAVSQSALGGLSGLGSALSLSGSLGKVLGVTGRVDLSGDPKLTMLAVPSAETTSAALASDITSLLARARLLTLLLPDQYGEKSALGSATAKATDQGVLVEATWPLEAIDRALEATAAFVPRL